MKSTESKPIDWDKIHRRLDVARHAMESAPAQTPAETRRILRVRAAALALERTQTETGERIEIVEFLLAGEHYGIESAFVREVHPLKDLTPVPCAPPFVLGIVNVRGRILPVIDIKRFFGLPEKGLSDLNKVIVLQNGATEFGVLADVIEGVRSIPLGALQPSLPTLTGIRQEYLKGVTQERRVVLDAAKLLADTGPVMQDERVSR